MGYGKMEGENSDKNIAYMIERDEAQGQVYSLENLGYIGSPAAGAISLRQSYECWKAGADPIEYAKEHKEFARAFDSFPGDGCALTSRKAMKWRCQRLPLRPVCR